VALSYFDAGNSLLWAGAAVLAVVVLPAERVRLILPDWAIALGAEKGTDAFSLDELQRAQPPDLGEHVSYTYDSLNRLIAAATTNGSGPQWSESYSYDGFGNQTAKTGTGGAPSVTPQVNSAANQVSMSGDNGFDLNGNWLGTGPSQVNKWNIENQLLSTGATDSNGNLLDYTYDPWGKRVLQYAAGGSYGPTGTLYFYSITGQLLQTFGQVVYTSTAPTPATPILYFGNRLLEPVDRLGSVRAEPSGSPWGGEAAAYYPWGEERTSTPDRTFKFATYWRDGYDSNTSNSNTADQDYAQARYYDNKLGRFWSVDPSLHNVDYSNPTSWNAYTYVNGDPINFNDPSGLSVITLPPVVPGTNCSTPFINFAAQLGMTIQGLFGQDAGILAIMSYFEQEGSGSTADQHVWAALDWTFVNRWNLSASAKAWFYGRGNAPTSFEATVTTGPTRSQVFTSSGQLTAGFAAQLLGILTGPPDSSQCAGLVEAFTVAMGVIEDANGFTSEEAIVPLVPDPYPHALAFSSGGRVPTHSWSVRQTLIGTIADGPNTWGFYSDAYVPPEPVRRPPPWRPSGPLQ